MLIDNLKISIKNIKERKSRVALTLIGIAIGIMAIVSLMSIGDGMQSAVTSELSSLSDTIIVTTGSIDVNAMGGGFSGGNGEYFTQRDIDDVNRIPGLKSVNPILFGYANLEFNGEYKMISLLGMEPESMSEIFGIDFLGLEYGDFMDLGDQNKCIVGYKVAHDNFDTDIRVGNKIKLNDFNFYVNGIYKKQGAGFSTETDDNIHLSVRDFRKITGQENVSGILIRVSDVSMVESIADDIEFSINENHGSDDFANVITMSSLLDSIQSVLSIISLFLVGIAGIALVVASIGIMNTMLTSVMERTHEIGVMKAIGARNYDILIIFLTEGMLISLIGGIVGTVLGILGGQAFSLISSSSAGPGIPIEPSITIYTISLAIGVALFVGIISSIYPARKAAKMSPIEAVRYE